MNCKPRTKAQDYKLADRIVRAQHEHPYSCDDFHPLPDQTWRRLRREHPVKTEIETVRRVLAKARI